MRKQFLFFVAVCGCFGQSATTFIHSDAAQLPTAEVERLLTIICPGHASVSGCGVCPEDTHDDSAGTWDLKAIFPGHFLSPQSEDVLISGMGCASHADSFGGSFLFAKDRSAWRKVRYEAGRIAWDCKKLRASDGRDRLACGVVDGNQGIFFSSLFLRDVGKTPPAVDPLDGSGNPDVMFFAVMDTAGSCMQSSDGTTQNASIERGEFESMPAKDHVRIVVFARLGAAVIPAKVLEGCEPGVNPKIATAPRRYKFIFDGTKILPARHNPPTRDRIAVAPRTSYSIAK